MLNAIFSALDIPIVNTVLVFLTVSALLYAIKPKLMFDDNGNMKQFGFSKNQRRGKHKKHTKHPTKSPKTCFTYTMVVFSSTLIAYIILHILAKIKNK